MHWQQGFDDQTEQNAFLIIEIILDCNLKNFLSSF